MQMAVNKLLHNSNPQNDWRFRLQVQIWQAMLQCHQVMHIPGHVILTNHFRSTLNKKDENPREYACYERVLKAIKIYSREKWKMS